MTAVPGDPAGRVRGERSATLGVLAGLALALLGVGVLLIGSSLEESRPPQVGPNLPISSGATDPRDISANNSPSLAADPANPSRLAVVNRVDAPRFSCALTLSADGGASWVPGHLPFPAGEELPERCFAPDAAFGSDGTLYVSFVTLNGVGNRPHALWTASSPDGGMSFGVPKRVSGPLTFQARLIADHERAGRLYLSWLQAADTGDLLFPSPGYPIVMARSDDGGGHWAAPERVSPASRQRVVGASLAQGPRGDLFAAYLDLGGDRLDYEGGHGGFGGEPYEGTWSLVVARSTDGGSTWRETDVDSRLIPIDRVIVFFPATPSLAVDRGSGRLYVAFHDARSGDADVYLWASGDGGDHFDGPVRVNDNRRKDGTWQYLPRVAVAPGGRVDVIYYDRRDDRANLRNDVSLQSSSDGGSTFGPRVRLTDKSFDSRIGFGSERDLPDLGSRLALISTDSRALAVWTDTRAGTEASGKQDLTAAGVIFTEGSALRAPLRYAGAGVVALGVFVGTGWAVVGLNRRRRGRDMDA